MIPSIVSLGILGQKTSSSKETAKNGLFHFLQLVYFPYKLFRLPVIEFCTCPKAQSTKNCFRATKNSQSTHPNGY